MERSTGLGEGDGPREGEGLVRMCAVPRRPRTTMMEVMDRVE